MHARTSLLTLLTIAAMLLLPAAAHADGEGQVLRPNIRDANATIAITKKPSIDSFTVKLICDAVDVQVTPPDVALDRCSGTLNIEAHTDRWYWLGAWTVVGSTQLDVPLGQSAVPVKVPGLAKLLAKRPDLYLKATYVDADGRRVDLSTQPDAKGILPVSMTVASTASCGIPARYSYSSRQAPQRVTKVYVGVDEHRTYTVESNRRTLDKRSWYRARAATTVRVNGLTYTIATGSEFAMQCARSTSSRMRQSAVLHLWHGSVRVTGKPRGAQKVTGVMVPPGLFSTSSNERVDITVSSNGNVRATNLRKIFSTARSRRGSLTAYQRLRMHPSAHCTPGRGIYMRMDGLTRVIR